MYWCVFGDVDGSLCCSRKGSLDLSFSRHRHLPFIFCHFFAAHGQGATSSCSLEGLRTLAMFSLRITLQLDCCRIDVTAPEKAFDSPQLSQQLWLSSDMTPDISTSPLLSGLLLLVVSSGSLSHPVVPVCRACRHTQRCFSVLAFSTIIILSVRPSGWTIALLSIFSVLAFSTILISVFALLVRIWIFLPGMLLDVELNYVLPGSSRSQWSPLSPGAFTLAMGVSSLSFCG